jgi:hypothetical protein
MAVETGLWSASRDLRMHSLRTIWNIHDASAAVVLSVPIFRYRTIRASCVASSASSGVEQSVRAKRRTCACEPSRSVAIARGSPCWAALTTRSVGQDRVRVSVTRASSQEEDAAADENRGHDEIDDGHDDLLGHGILYEASAVAPPRKLNCTLIGQPPCGHFFGIVM